MTDPKLLAEQQQRAELERLAKADPDSWAAQALEARNIAIAELALHKKGSPYLTRAIRGLQLAETLERQVMKRYKTDEKAKKANAGPQQDPPTDQNPFTEALRTEHQADSGRPTTTGTDPATNEPATPNEQANGVLAGARGGAGPESRVATAA